MLWNQKCPWLSPECLQILMRVPGHMRRKRADIDRLHKSAFPDWNPCLTSSIGLGLQGFKMQLRSRSRKIALMRKSHPISRWKCGSANSKTFPMQLFRCGSITFWIRGWESYVTRYSISICIWHLIPMEMKVGAETEETFSGLSFVLTP